MKKTLILAYLFLLLAPVFSVSAFAKAYTLDDLCMTIVMPDNLEIAPHGTGLIESQPDVYLSALSYDSLYEITVVMVENTGSNEIFDFNNYENYKIEAMAYKTKNETNQYGVTWTDYSVYQSSQTKFLVMEAWRQIDSMKVYIK